MVSPDCDCPDGRSSNVQVVLRVKPRSDRESVILEMLEDPRMVVVVDKPFAFDHVIWENGSQEQAYEASASSLVEKALEGYNATVLAYGQTGTGKTYTMGSVSPDESANTGLIHRCLSRIFQQKETQVFISFMEIYNEELHDLLNMRHKLTTRNGVPTPRIQGVDSLEESLTVVGNALKFRQTNLTKLNTVSSRSHALLTLHLKVQHRGKLLESKLNLVDLAGSESVKRTQAQGLALVEGCNINKSLLALSTVVAALAKNTSSTHVPYRNSMLTSTLQDSLGGKSLISLIACVSPDPEDLYESASTMRFAERVRMVKTKPDLNLDFSNSLEKNKVEIPRLSTIVPPISLERSANIILTKSTASTPSFKRTTHFSTPAPKKIRIPSSTPATKEQNKGHSVVAERNRGNVETLKSQNGDTNITTLLNNTALNEKNGATIQPTPKQKNKQAYKAEGVWLHKKENQSDTCFKTPAAKGVKTVKKTPTLTMLTKENMIPTPALDRRHLDSTKNSKIVENDIEAFAVKINKISNILKDTTNFENISKAKDEGFKNISLSLSETPCATNTISVHENDLLLSIKKDVESLRRELDNLTATVVKKKSIIPKITEGLENENLFNNFKVPQPIPRPRRSMRRMERQLETPLPQPRLSLLQDTPKPARKVSIRKYLTLENDNEDCANEVIPVRKFPIFDIFDGEDTCLNENPTMNRRRSTRLSLKRQAAENAATLSVQIRSLEHDGNVNRGRSTRLSSSNTVMKNDGFSVDDSVLSRNCDLPVQVASEISNQHCFDKSNADDKPNLRLNANVDCEPFEVFQDNEKRRRSMRLSLRRLSKKEIPEDALSLPNKKLGLPQILDTIELKDVRPQNRRQGIDDKLQTTERPLSDKQITHNLNILKILNEGNKEQLKALPRIGPKTAMVIHNYRELNGVFESFDDLTKVPVWTKAFVKRFLLANNVILE